MTRSRRRLGMVLLALCGLAGAARGGAQESGYTRAVERQAYLMGTRARLVALDTSRPRALSRLDRMLGVLEATEAQLSTWTRESRLSELNRWPIGTSLALAPDLCRLLGVLDDWRRQTTGAFDPAVGRLLEAWQVRGSGAIPPESVRRTAHARSGLQYVTLDRQSCRATRHADVAIDAGAFGKGEALDRVGRLHAALDPVAPWLIDLGGQIMVYGRPPDSGGWQVALAHPRDRDRRLLELVLRHGSLATSGGAERDRIAAGRRIGHVLDPRTGHPAAFDGSVAVWHESALVADIVSTALYVLGPAAGLAWAEDRQLAAVFLVPTAASADGSVAVRPTPAFAARFPASRR